VRPFAQAGRGHDFLHPTPGRRSFPRPEFRPLTPPARFLLRLAYIVNQVERLEQLGLLNGARIWFIRTFGELNAPSLEKRSNTFQQGNSL